MQNISFFRTMALQGWAAIARFPLTILACIILYSLSLSDTYWIGGNSNIGLFSLMLLFISLITTLFFETRGRKLLQTSLVTIGITTAVFCYFRFYPTKYMTDLLALYLAAILLFSCAPFLTRRDNEAQSYYWQRLILAACWGLFNFLVFAIGFSAVIATINTLFEDILSNKWYEELWRFSTLLFLPLACLSMVPRNEELQNITICTAPRALKVSITWLMIPLCLILLTILYAFFIKTVMIGGFPKSVLVSIIMSISIYSIFVYLISAPLVHEDSPPAKFVQRFLFWILIIPVAVLAWRFGVRIGVFGMTEARFYAALIILWLAFNIFYQITQWRKGLYDLRMPLLSAAIILTLVALSPVSPQNFEAATNKGETIQAFVSKKKFDLTDMTFHSRDTSDHSPTKEYYFSHYSHSDNLMIDIKGFDNIFNASWRSKTSIKSPVSWNDVTILNWFEGQYLVIQFNKDNAVVDTLTIDLDPAIKKLLDKYGSEKRYPDMKEPLVIDSQGKNYKVRLIIENIYFKKDKTDPKMPVIITSVDGFILLTHKVL